MHISTSRIFRRTCAVMGVSAWAAAAAFGITESFGGKSDPIHAGFLFCLSVAVATTVTGLVGSAVAPVEATFRHVYNAGWADCHREIGRPVVVPESRLAEKREVKLDAS